MIAFNPHPNPWKAGDRVRVGPDGPPQFVGRVGTVESGGGMSLGIPNEFNTRVALDDWEHGDARPIFNDMVLERVEDE